MDLSKKLLLLKHIDSFIREQYEIGTSVRDILGMISYKSNHYQKKLETDDMSNIRREYVQNYALYLKKRVIDFQYFRKKEEFKDFNDIQVFGLLDMRDKIIFNKLYNK